MNTKKVFFGEKYYASIGLLLFFCAYPFYFNNGYHDITFSRTLFFCTVAAVVFTIYLADIKVHGHGIIEFAAARVLRRKAADIAAVLFFLSQVVSLITAEHFSASLYGDAGRYMGFITYLSFFLIYIWISDIYILREIHFMIAGIVLCIVCLFSCCQFFGMDIFYLLKTVAKTARINFMSPFGNINVFSEYLCVFTPFMMFMFCGTKSKRKMYVYIVSSIFGFFGLFSSNSDSGYIGIGIAFVLLFFYFSHSRNDFFRFLVVCLAFSSSAVVFGLLQRGIDSSRGLSNITAVIVDIRLSLCAAIFFAIALFLLPDNCDQLLVKLRKPICAILILLPLFALGLFVYFSFIDRNLNIGAFDKYLRFSDSWGTDRGFIWSSLMEVYKESPLLRKIFGYGEDSIGLIMAENFKSKMLDEMRYVTNNAHNEYLHYLLCNGVFGLAAYVFLLFKTIKSCVSSGEKLKSAILFAVVSYSAQSFFNIIQPIATPFVFIFVALSQCDCDSETEFASTNMSIFGWIKKKKS